MILSQWHVCHACVTGMHQPSCKKMVAHLAVSCHLLWYTLYSSIYATRSLFIDAICYLLIAKVVVMDDGTGDEDTGEGGGCCCRNFIIAKRSMASCSLRTTLFIYL